MIAKRIRQLARSVVSTVQSLLNPVGIRMSTAITVFVATTARKHPAKVVEICTKQNAVIVGKSGKFLSNRTRTRSYIAMTALTRTARVDGREMRVWMRSWTGSLHYWRSWCSRDQFAFFLKWE